ncbi:1,4-alpha-glucan branching enzyme [Niastella yeongjuensis]|uniref:1,4-alpha-glucan branching enzyme GlgB n=1 Tax=Niastella yeongjuensis TaxID=354355 RepID=A0A1V9E4B1_9BACT|nr:1,4-alpha-glucan branching protein GlgB [Niastella yeongjuensis]OQP40960.1 1,4-alpha-glucan branching enzyme [Niastella yeongjuensis]SEO96546.1 1,4-alpha-glucan branching enzyme [Niastella yeongjuensis]
MEVKKYEEVHFVDSTRAVWNYSFFTEDDIRNFQHGTHYRLYDLFGSHEIEVLGKKGYYFAVWAPNATAVSVIGNFNDWNPTSHPLFVRLDKSGIWEGFIPNLPKGEVYKYHIDGFKGVKTDKGDPYANFWEKRPNTASITWNLDYTWKDAGWMDTRGHHNSLEAPCSIYEVHLASWMRPDKHDEESYNTYDQIRDLMVPYVKEMGFTHVEFMPVMEHPFDGSWGYQGTGYFAPTSRFGDPQSFMELVNAFHEAGIGVILDWVPSHFPYDAHGLFMFDGANTYEYADMRKGFHPDWNSYVFNYKRGEVKSFLISSARFWFDKFHIDGIRVDAVSSMLKLNYSRTHGQWEPNEYGGDGNIEAITFIKDLNETMYRDFHDIQSIAEEATDWPGVSRPTFQGGLGFGMKWMMGWMHDTLDYFKMDPIYRRHYQNKFSFSMMYYYDENFLLPLSHDEVVHGKSPMIFKMPGDEWQKFANLRTLYTYMFTHPGGKLLFMGNEFGDTNEWNYKSELQWDLLKFDSHRMLKDCVRDLNLLLRNEPAMYENQFNIYGFEWVDLNHTAECVVAYRRKGKNPENDLLIILNLTPVVRHDWKVYTHGKSQWREVFNSDDKRYWGTGNVFNPEISTRSLDKNDNMYEINVHLPPLGAIVLK